MLELILPWVFGHWVTRVGAGSFFVVHHHHPLLRCFFRGLFVVMAVTADKFFLHVIAVPKSLHIERHPFSPAVLDRLPGLVGDRSGQCDVEITRRYFRNHPLFVIAADDNFTNKGWPVCAIINDRWFRGALVILAERAVDPAGRPLQGATYLDGLTSAECDDASSFIGAPPGTPWPKSVFPRRNRVRY
jgi:hypothetical protein